MTQVKAVSRHENIEPLEPVQLKFAEKSHVVLKISSASKEDALEWMRRVRKIREQIREREGVLPDSTPDIAEDRMR